MATTTYTVTGTEPVGTVTVKEVTVDITLKPITTQVDPLTVAVVTNDPINHAMPNNSLIKFRYVEDATKFSDTKQFAVTKFLTEPVSATSVIAFTIGRARVDTASVADSVSKRPSKTFTEAFDSSDSSFLVFNKAVIETKTFSEQRTMVLVRQLLDVADVQDRYASTLNKIKQDSSFFSDSSRKTVAKVKQDQLALGSYLAKTLLRQFTSSITLSEGFFEARIGVEENQTSSAAVSDSVSLRPMKLLSSQAQFSVQSLEFYKRSYFAQDYDLERYSGSITTI